MEEIKPNDDQIDKKLANYLIHDIDISSIIKVVEKHHNEPGLIHTLQQIDAQHKDLALSAYDTAQVIKDEAPQFKVFHILHEELAKSKEDLRNIIEELYGDQAMTQLIENFEDKTGISLIGAIQEDEYLHNRYKIRLETFRQQLYDYLTGEYKGGVITMNYVVVTKKTLAELLVADHNNRE